jgi:hypothetical protein
MTKPPAGRAQLTGRQPTAKRGRLGLLHRQARYRALTYSSIAFANGAIASRNALMPAAFRAVLVDLSKVLLPVS